jgi:hypothetical protein
MDREYAITYLQTELGLSREDAERKLDSLIHTYEPELDALSVTRDTCLTSEDEVYFIRIIDNEK